ncbi:MAG: MerR family transcriptional regulator [Actinomycetota bacterium]|nr:MerR family transcriptional regulator [Actinomycetota bacterium]
MNRGDLSRIGEVADRLGVSPRTIKYYEEIGLLIPGERSPGGFRLYAEPDVERLRRILRLKDMGFSLAAIREFISVRDDAREATREIVLQETTKHLEAREHELTSRIDKLRRDLESAEDLRQELQRDIALCQSRMRELKKSNPP